MRPDSTASRIVAVLGPTNTGKTHLAIERLLGHRSGMIGFPLRLLARENYDKIVRLKGKANVALITGEERILPPFPRWFICTVEAMPLDRQVEFLAIDEIQMAADRERGHVFTSRLLHARGISETMFLGAETAKPIIRKLVPEAEFIARPRFSTLSYVGPRKITRLPRRSAVVAFSAAEVYGIAELVRRQRGGAAVVFGALSPRTRNAQVQMYQAGEVDYLVATDAIGMGLNMDIDHVAFAQLSKFDGRAPRHLTPAELGQIAGRAGRHMADGTFGTIQEIGPLDPATIDAIENHRFPALKHVYWRNGDLDFVSPEALLRSLDRRSTVPELIRMREADDHMTLAALTRDAEAMELARGSAAVRLLWECCQIPDFRKTLADSHARLVGRIFRFLRAAPHKLPEDWVANQVARLDRTEGDIDALLSRIAHIRTWTYVSHRGAWLADSAHWQERTRAIEDKLSDALHERLTQRFVDRRAAALGRRLKDGDELLAAVTQSGDVLVEGQFAGKLEGFNFAEDAGARDGARTLLAAANKALRRDIGDRVRRFVTAPDEAFALDARGLVRWQEFPVARLVPGDTPLTPRVEILPADLLEPRHRDEIRRRLQDWLDAYIARTLAPLLVLRDAPLTGTARGLAFALMSQLGSASRPVVAEQLAALTGPEHQALTAAGVHIGQAVVHVPALRSRESVALRAVLWACARGQDPAVASASLPQGRSLPVNGATMPAEFMAACAYLQAGPLYVRADRLEGLATRLRGMAKRGPFAATDDLGKAIGAAPADLAGVLAALGYRAMPGMVFVPRPAARKARKSAEPDAHSPFASLHKLKSQ